MNLEQVEKVGSECELNWWGDRLIVYLEVCQFHNVLLTAKAEKSVKAKIVYIGKDITTKVSFKIKKDSIIN